MMAEYSEYYLQGESGRRLGPSPRPLSEIGVRNDGVADVTWRSLGIDELKLKMQGDEVPEDDQWVTLFDHVNRPIFTGKTSVEYDYMSDTYLVQAHNFYKGLVECPFLTTDGRPLVVFPAQNLRQSIIDCLERAIALGVDFQLGEVVDFYSLPRMTFKMQSIASVLQELCSWDAGAVTQVDYSTSPPTLHVRSRWSSRGKMIDLDADDHGVISLRLAPKPDARALAVSFDYARRNGSSVSVLRQSAGDLEAASARRLSVFLSGAERADFLAAEALATANDAIRMAKELATAANVSVEAKAQAQIFLTRDGLAPFISQIEAARVANFTLVPSIGETVSVYAGAGGGNNTYYAQALTLKTMSGQPNYWWPIKPGVITDDDLLTAGAVRGAGVISGWLISQALSSAQTTQLRSILGSLQRTVYGYYHNIVLAWVYLEVETVSMSPQAIARAVQAANGVEDGLVQAAKFVEAPPDLALNYFNRQDFLPFQGTMQIHASGLSAGDFINVRGSRAQAAWIDMRCAVSELVRDLRDNREDIQLNSSGARFDSLLSKLKPTTFDNMESQ